MEETNWLMTILGNPFAKGLAIGLLVCVLIYLRGLLRRREDSVPICTPNWRSTQRKMSAARMS